MAIKNTPVNFRTYYKHLMEVCKDKKNNITTQLEELEKECSQLYNEIKDNATKYKEDYSFDLAKYSEFVNNEYSTGTFLKASKGAFVNRRDEYELVADLYDLYKLAKYQKQIYLYKKDLALVDKILSLGLYQYKDILKAYYTEVHKKLILDGAGYVFDNNMGWICINRCHLNNPKRPLDYAATKRRKEELIKEGKRIYNKEEADWCARNGLEYKAEDVRVFMNNEYCYEIPLINCKLIDGRKLKLDITDYRGAEIRGKTNEDLIKECDGDIDKICELSVDLKTKLTLCNKVNKMLYTKFIRNEAQKSINATSTNRKNRQ